MRISIALEHIYFCTTVYISLRVCWCDEIEYVVAAAAGDGDNNGS